MFFTFRRLLRVCFELVSSLFQLFATFGCSAHHHQDYQQHNQNNNNNNNNSNRPSTATVGTAGSNGAAVANGTPLSSSTKSSHHRVTYNSNGARSRPIKASSSSKTQYEEPIRPVIPLRMLLINYLCHGTLMMFGILNDFLRAIGCLKTHTHVEKNREGYTPLFNTFAPFYVRNIIHRLVNMWGHPICSVPGVYTEILERKFSNYNTQWIFTGRKIRTINFGSYDYLGHAENRGPRIDSVMEHIKQYGVSVSSVPNELGTHESYAELEKKVARYLGVDDSIVVGMGFATNSLSLPCLFGPGSLVLSDECNHASLALGCKLSGAKIRVFKHNNMVHLEKIIRQELIAGQPDNWQPWKKIVILVEGIYSMEGTIVNLPELIRIKKKYHAYVYMDEAHSIGAMGARGRGICDYFGCDPRDVDILMGTFTKSFAAAGGYIAGDRNIIDYIRTNSMGFHYGTSMSPPICQQISLILEDFLALDAPTAATKPPSALQRRITQLRRNVFRFRNGLRQLGFHIDGNHDSPVVPLMTYTPTQLKCLIAKLLERGVASTGAAFPVTSLTGIRARFCLSAAHTDQMIDYTLQCMDEIGSEIGLKFDEAKVKCSTIVGPTTNRTELSPPMIGVIA